MQRFSLDPGAPMPNITTPAASSMWCISMPVLINGQRPRLGETAPKITVEGRSYEEALAMHAQLMQLLGVAPAPQPFG